MSPNIGDPSYSQVPDPRLHSQPPREPPFTQICRQKGCGGKIDPQTGKCLRCGFLHGKSATRYTPLIHSQKPATPAHPVSPPSPVPEARAFSEKTPEPSISQSKYDTQYSQASRPFSKELPPSQYSGTGYSNFAGYNFWEKIRDRAQEFRGTVAFWWTIRGLVILLFGFAGFWIYHNVDWSITTPATKPEPAPNTAVISSTVPGQLENYNLTVNVEHPEGGSVLIDPNETSYKSGASVVLSAQAANGYIFGRWSGDIDVSQASQPTISVKMDGDKSIIACFDCVDEIAPEIRNIRTRENTYSDVSATIEWETDEKTTSYISYKTADAKEYSNPLPAITSDNLIHRAKIFGLKPNTAYRAQVEAIDSCGNAADAQTYLFNTSQRIYEGHEVGKRAPNLALVTYPDLEPFELSKYLPRDGRPGEKKIFLDFWSTYCGACIYEFRWIRYTHEKIIELEEAIENADEAKLNGELAEYAYLKDWEIITVCIDIYDDPNKPYETYEDRKRDIEIRFQKLEDRYKEDLEGGKLQPTFLYSPEADRQAYPVWQLPMHIFIDEDGIIREVQLQRFKRASDIQEIMEKI